MTDMVEVPTAHEIFQKVTLLDGTIREVVVVCGGLFSDHDRFTSRIRLWAKQKGYCVPLLAEAQQICDLIQHDVSVMGLRGVVVTRSAQKVALPGVVRDTVGGLVSFSGKSARFRWAPDIGFVFTVGQHLV